jgi:hypothetical protein
MHRPEHRPDQAVQLHLFTGGSGEIRQDHLGVILAAEETPVDKILHPAA